MDKSSFSTLPPVLCDLLMCFFLFRFLLRKMMGNVYISTPHKAESQRSSLYVLGRSRARINQEKQRTISFFILNCFCHALFLVFLWLLLLFVAWLGRSVRCTTAPPDDLDVGLNHASWVGFITFHMVKLSLDEFLQCFVSGHWKATGQVL